MTQQSYIIVGSGVFGASSALELVRCKPNANVILVDRHPAPSPSSASSDLNKIIRADYRDPMYAKLALDAIEHWKSDPLYSPYFHETGMLFAESEGKGPASLRNLQSLGAARGARLMSVGEARAKFPAFEMANWSGVESAYYNPKSGWSEAEESLKAVVKEATDLGVIFCEARISKLILESQDNKNVDKRWECKGVITEDGTEMRADTVLLCIGAHTASLLADSAPKEPNFQANGRLVAAAALQCSVQIPPSKWAKCREAPVFANLMSHTCGEAIPMNSNGVIKLNYEKSFTNFEYHSASGQMISRPSPAVGAGVWTDDVPKALADEAATVIKNTYGPDLGFFQIKGYRICWDAITPNQDWIIAPHSSCDNLFIAAGGSFHAFKFLPILGREIVSMMDGKLDPTTAQRWSWNRYQESKEGACDSYWPKRDLKDILATSDRIKSRA